MLTRLIVNADDLAVTRGVNQAIGELHRAGALTSATLMASGQAFADAVELARAHPSLGIGCHVVLTDGAPLSPPAKVTSLLGKSLAGEPRLRSSLGDFARAAMLGLLKEAEIERETEMQLTRVLDTGIPLTHVDTHKHTHLFPVVLRAVTRAAERLGIAAIRNPFEPAWAMQLGRGTLVRRLQMRALNGFAHSFREQPTLRSGELQTTDGAIGVSATGQLSVASLSALLNALPPGTWELVCHPGYHDAELQQIKTRLQAEREIERQALLALIPPLRQLQNVELITFADLARAPATVDHLAMSAAKN